MFRFAKNLNMGGVTGHIPNITPNHSNKDVELFRCFGGAISDAQHKAYEVHLLDGSIVADGPQAMD